MESTSAWHASGVADRPCVRNSDRTKESRSAGLVVFGQATSRARAFARRVQERLALGAARVQQDERDLLGRRTDTP
ncbi:hypothetical protein SMICM304S_07621 [Streptomyces microflavus]